MNWFAALIATPMTFWAIAALYFDFPISRLRLPIALAYAVFVTATLWTLKVSGAGIILWIGSLAVVVIWWLRIPPSTNRNWKPDVAEQPWAEIDGSLATIHNVRDFEYRTESDFTPHWETRTVDLSQISGVDLFLTHWGSQWIAHPILSFQFADGTYLAISIEGRKEVGQKGYSAVRGLFRQFHLIYIVADERDVVRLRTNYRTGERVRLYHTLTTPSDARNLFIQYLQWMEHIRNQPQWYNALTSNCSTGVISYFVWSKLGGLSRYDWRNLLNGRGDEMLYQLGDLATGGLSFRELARRAVINGAAKQANSATDFSHRIREGRPGF